MPRLDGKKLPRLEFRHIDRRTIREKDRFHYENNLSHLCFLLLWACVHLLPIIATFSANISPIQTNVPIFIIIIIFSCIASLYMTFVQNQTRVKSSLMLFATKENAIETRISFNLNCTVALTFEIRLD